jgi:hypothetical protein
VPPLIESIFNLHPIFEFRCKVQLLLESFLLATDGKRGWIRRPDFGLHGAEQRVLTTTRSRIVKWLTEIVAIEKPVEAAARSLVPTRIPS